ncbi:MAG: radical SAM protein [Lutisporaceae bacterium]
MDRIIFKQRYGETEEAAKTLDAYLIGAKYCLAGHFSMYPPTSIPELNFEPREEIQKQINQGKNKPVGLYIHWPFCKLPHNKVKCDFCCSNARNDNKSKALRDEYFKAIIKEITLYSDLLKGNHLEWVYIGGGTPLTMTADELDRLFNILYTTELIDRETFITVESRPEMINNIKVSILKKHNIRRISMGAESFNNEIAITMGRVRSDNNYKEIVKNAIDILKKAEIPFINIDLIYGHPMDTYETVMESVEYAASLEPDSISAYAMGMPFGLTLIEQDVRKGLKLKDMEFRYEAYVMINKFLKGKGYGDVYDCIWSKYEVDSYRTLTNKKGIVNMWNQTCILPYGIWIGVGIGAYGYIGGVGPTQNTNDLEKYIELISKGKLGVTEGIKYEIDEILRAEIVLSLLHRTIDVNRFINCYGVHPTDIFPIELDLLKSRGFIEYSGNEIKVTPKAIPLLQGIARLFFSSEFEKNYRALENRRIDYKTYGISYNELP